MPPKKEKNATRHRITGQHFIYLLIESKQEASNSCFVANRLKINKIRYRDRNTVNLWGENEVKLASFDQLYVLSEVATISVLRKAPKLREQRFDLEALHKEGVQQKQRQRQVNGLSSKKVDALQLIVFRPVAALPTSCLL